MVFLLKNTEGLPQRGKSPPLPTRSTPFNVAIPSITNKEKAVTLVTKQPPLLNYPPKEDMECKSTVVVSVTKEAPLLKSVLEDDGGGKFAADEVLVNLGIVLGKRMVLVLCKVLVVNVKIVHRYI